MGRGSQKNLKAFVYKLIRYVMGLLNQASIEMAVMLIPDSVSADRMFDMPGRNHTPQSFYLFHPSMRGMTPNLNGWSLRHNCPFLIYHKANDGILFC